MNYKLSTAYDAGSWMIDFKVIFMLKSTLFKDKNQWVHLFCIFINKLIDCFFHFFSEKCCKHGEHILEEVYAVLAEQCRAFSLPGQFAPCSESSNRT